MELTVGTVTEGKVTGITKFGAFVALPGGKSGMVHISEVANAFVQDISQHVQEGQTVKVVVIGIDERGRINLSIKRALPKRNSLPVPLPETSADLFARRIRIVRPCRPRPQKPPMNFSRISCGSLCRAAKIGSPV